MSDLIVNLIKKNCKSYGISVQLEETEFIMINKIPVSGYFSETESIIRVAIQKPVDQWLPILIHEYCHFLQYIEQAEVYRKLIIDGQNANSLLDDWLNHKIELSPEKLDKIIEVIFNLEKDCELRTISMLKDFNLNIDISVYIQKANSYLNLYKDLKNTRSWPQYERMPYFNYNNYKNMESKSLIDFF